MGKGPLTVEQGPQGIPPAGCLIFSGHTPWHSSSAKYGYEGKHFCLLNTGWKGKRRTLEAEQTWRMALWRETEQGRLLVATTSKRGQAHRSPIDGERGDGWPVRGQGAPRCRLLKLHLRGDGVAGSGGPHWARREEKFTDPVGALRAGQVCVTLSVCVLSKDG